MIPVILILIAILSYGLGALSGAMILGRFVFHKDLRKYGSGNVGYTNFVRVFGGKWGPAVIAVDVLKSAIAVLAGGLLMLIRTDCMCRWASCLPGCAWCWGTFSPSSTSSGAARASFAA